jgi:hypothetical protein
LVIEPKSAFLDGVITIHYRYILLSDANLNQGNNVRNNKKDIKNDARSGPVGTFKAMQ